MSNFTLYQAELASQLASCTSALVKGLIEQAIAKESTLQEVEQNTSKVKGCKSFDFAVEEARQRLQEELAAKTANKVETKEVKEEQTSFVKKNELLSQKQKENFLKKFNAEQENRQWWSLRGELEKLTADMEVLESLGQTALLLLAEQERSVLRNKLKEIESAREERELARFLKLQERFKKGLSQEAVSAVRQKHFQKEGRNLGLPQVTPATYKVASHFSGRFINEQN